MPERIREATTGKMPTTICWWWRMETITTSHNDYHTKAVTNGVADSLQMTDYKDPPTVTKIIGGVVQWMSRRAL